MSSLAVPFDRPFNNTDYIGPLRVLVVDNDANQLSETAETVRELGYSCSTARCPLEALKEIAVNPQVAIVLTDIDLPRLDGLTLLQEISARFSNNRPIVTLGMSQRVNVEVALDTIRAGASDFVSKPVSTKSLARCLRAASTQWSILSNQRRLLRMVGVNSSGNSDQEFIGPPERDSSRAKSAKLEVPDRELQKKLVRAIIKGRERRSAFIETSFFSDPAWDIMLDLTSAALEGRSVPVSSACVAANVPVSTALRYIRLLVSAGVVKRWDDPSDKRRALLALEDEALEGMIRYISDIWQSMAPEAFLSVPSKAIS